MFHKQFCRLFFFPLLLAGLAFGQADVATATLKGTVTDPTGAVIPNATVTVKDTSRGITRTATSNNEGIFLIPLLPPGIFELRATANGFKTQVANGLELRVGDVSVFDLRMDVGQVAEEMVVEATVQTVEVERTQQSNTIGERQVDNLPNVTRDFTSYVFTLPGVASSQAPRAQHAGFTFGTSGFSIGGSNGRSNLVTLDGGENEYGSGQLRITTLSVEAVQEFQVNRNGFNAEFGFTAGTAVNVVTKSGTNRWDGSVYTFYRSQKTSARNFFDRNPRRAFDQQMYPGFTFGGPIKKDKLFFFTSYEYLKSDSARFRSYTNNPQVLAPSAAQAALLAQLDAAPDANIRRISASLRPRLITTNFPTTMNFLRANEQTFTAFGRFHTWSTKVDWNLNEKNQISGRFTLSRRDTDETPVENGVAPSNGTLQQVRDYTAVATWTHSFSGRAINQLRGQIVPNNSATTQSKAPGTSALVIPGLATFNGNFTAPFNTFQDRYQFEDIFSLNRGRHNIKMGISARPVSYEVINELWFRGQWDFTSGVYPLAAIVPAADAGALIGFLGGAPSAATNLTALQSFNLGLPFLYRQGFNNPRWTGTATFIGTFIQDSWKISKRLSMDFGVRWDHDREPKPLKTYNFFSPRIGIAWDPFGDQKTVIRSGFGLFFSPVYYQVSYLTNILNDSGQYINQIFRTPASGAQQTAAIWAFAQSVGKAPFGSLSEAELNRFGIATGPRSPGRVIFEADPNYRPNYSIQANFGIERQILPSLTLDVAWQMYRGVAIQLSRETNVRESGVVSPQFGPQYTFIDPAIAQRNVYGSIGNSIYHGLTVSANKRFSKNFQFQANYTWSKTIDDVTDFNSAFSAFMPTRLFAERGLSVFDIRHNFVASGVVMSPWKGGQGNAWKTIWSDIQFSPIVSARTGIPFTGRMGRDVNGDNRPQNDRPFAEGRNTGLGPNFFGVDARITKQFWINRESGLRVDFVVESTNLLNKTNFLAVNDIIGNDPALVAGPYNFKGDKSRLATQPLGFTAAADPRRIQFGLRIAF